MVAAAEQSVKEQQKLFDELKKQVVLFKRDILSQFNDQINLVSEIPDAIELEPEIAAEMVEISPSEEIEENETAENNDIERIISGMHMDEDEKIDLDAEIDEAEIDIAFGDFVDLENENDETDNAEQKATSFKVNIDFDEDETEAEEFSDEDDVNILPEIKRVQYTFDGEVSEILE